LALAKLILGWQDLRRMNAIENQFSLTRAASSTSGRARNQIPIGRSKMRPVKLCPALNLVGFLALLAAGCGTTSVHPRTAVMEPALLEIDGLALTVQPMTDKAQLNRSAGNDGKIRRDQLCRVG
jgi:hypothetical protein